MSGMDEWIIQLLSSEIEHILKPSDKKNLMCNFIFKLFSKRIEITDDTQEAKDVQVFIAVRRAYANDDLAFLRYHLFRQYFGELTASNLEKISDEFPTAISKLEMYFNYPLKDRIYNYIKNQMLISI